MNDWPDPNKPGVPLNPDRDGWHMVQALPSNKTARTHDPVPCDWKAGPHGGWAGGVYAPGYAVAQWRYVGPCVVPGVQGIPEGLRIALFGWWCAHHHGGRQDEREAEEALCEAIEPLLDALRKDMPR